jgi:hypothetical protein
MKQRMKVPYEKGVAIRSASSLALGIARYTTKRRQRMESARTSLQGCRDFPKLRAALKWIPEIREREPKFRLSGHYTGLAIASRG